MEFAHGSAATVEEECLRCYPAAVDITGAVRQGSGALST